MAKNRGSNEGFDPSLSMPAEQKNRESNRQKIARIHEMFSVTTKDSIAKILQYYDDDENQAINAITSDGGKEALSNWTELGSLKTRNNKNKKKKKKGKKDAGLATSNTASFDADDSSSIHSGCNIEIEAEKSSQTTENLNDNPGVPDNILSNDEHIDNNEAAAKDSSPEPEIPPHRLAAPAASATVLEETTHRASVPSDFSRDSVESESRVSPLSTDNSEKQAEQGIKKDKFRSINVGHNRHSPRQRTGSFRRNKSSSISEDSSSQTNPQAAAAAPTKRGFEQCKEDLQRHAASLQRINAQVEKGFEDSEKRLKNAFADILTKIENRQKELEQELTRRKIEAFDLLKSRQELCAEYKSQTDRTSSLSEAERAELWSDIKQFVTERKYDDDLGKTIWFQWPDISEALQTFGDVCPVKNVYSQRSHSGNEYAATSNNPKSSPLSSIDRNDIEMATFSETPFSFLKESVSQHTLKALEEMNFKLMTDIQAKTIPHLLEGKDVVTSSKTPSGKTLAFLIPAIEVLSKLNFCPIKGTGVVIICPTKRQSHDTYKTLKKLLVHHEFSHCLILGESRIQQETKQLNAGVDILVVTSRRLLDHLQNQKLVMRTLKLLVIDNADKIEELGVKQIKSIIRTVPVTRQTILVCASISKKIEDLIEICFPKDPIYICADKKETDAAENVVDTADHLNEFYVICKNNEKYTYLHQFLKERSKAKIVIFFSTHHSVQFYEQLLKFSNINVISIHGNQPKATRAINWNIFCINSGIVLACTNVAAQNLGTSQVDYIVQYDPPTDSKNFLYRVGTPNRFAIHNMMFLHPEEMDFLSVLRNEGLLLAKCDIEWRNIKSIQSGMEFVVSSNRSGLGDAAKRAYTSFIHSYQLRNKRIFDINKIGLKEAAQSFGLSSPPLGLMEASGTY